MYKMYKYTQIESINGIEGVVDKYIVLEAQESVGSWIFDSVSFCPKLTQAFWLLALSDLNKLLVLIKDIFSINLVNVCIDTGLKEFLYSVQLSSIEHINSIEANVQNWILNLPVDFDYNSISIKIQCNGKCYINDTNSINCNLFNIQLAYNNRVSVEIETNNFCFLPNNPISKTRQYHIWQKNAPKLAQLLFQFNKSTELDLLTESGDLSDYGIISDNVYYLSNKPITGVLDENWDEFYIPFEILSNDQVFK